MLKVIANDITNNTVALDQFLNLYIKPEIEKRQSIGTLPKPFQLKVARAIFCLGNKEPIIQINDEIGIIEIKLKDGISKKAGEPITDIDIDWGAGLNLPPEYANCGHMTVFIIGNRIYLSFDFRYNKAVSRNIIATAKQFNDTASDALSKKNYSPFIDNLFSASELAAKCIVLASLATERKMLDNHSRIQEEFTKLADYVNIQEDLKKAFHKLRAERVPARYLKGMDCMYEIDEKDAQSLLQRVKQLIDKAEVMIK